MDGSQNGRAGLELYTEPDTERDTETVYNRAASTLAPCYLEEAVACLENTHKRKLMADDEVRIPANPDEPTAGDFAFAFSEKIHPVNGDPYLVNFFKRQLRGMFGQRVRLKIKAGRINQDTRRERKFNLTSTFEMNRYTDLFGPNSAWNRALHAAADRCSDEELVVYDFDIEVA